MHAHLHIHTQCIYLYTCLHTYISTMCLYVYACVWMNVRGKNKIGANILCIKLYYWKTVFDLLKKVDVIAYNFIPYTFAHLYFQSGGVCDSFDFIAY